MLTMHTTLTMVITRSCICSRRDDMMSTIHRLKNRITDVGQWMSANWLKLNTEKTELLWAGSRHSQSSLLSISPARGRHCNGARQRPSAWSDNLVGLSLQRHVPNMSATAFYWLHQLIRVRWSLDSESAATLVHAFVTSRVDQCNAIHAGATKSCHWHFAACYERCRTCRQWHKKVRPWPDSNIAWWLTLAHVADRVTYKLGVIMHRRRHSKAPQYLVNCCTPVTDAVGTQKPHSHTATDGGATPSAIHCWMPSIRCARPHGRKLLAGDLRAQQNHKSFKQGLKTWL